MRNIHQDLKDIFVEIPETSSNASHEKLNNILIIYSKYLAILFHQHNLSEYFSHLHTMCHDIKAISKSHVNPHTQQTVFIKTRTTLIQDLYQLILITASESDLRDYRQAQ